MYAIRKACQCETTQSEWKLCRWEWCSEIPQSWSQQKVIHQDMSLGCIRKKPETTRAQDMSNEWVMITVKLQSYKSCFVFWDETQWQMILLHSFIFSSPFILIAYPTAVIYQFIEGCHTHLHILWGNVLGERMKLKYTCNYILTRVTQV